MEQDQGTRARREVELETMSLRQFLLLTALREDTNMFIAIEAVSTTALAHPEWDMNERKPLAVWMREFGTA